MVITWLRKNIGMIVSIVGLVLMIILTFGNLGELFTEKERIIVDMLITRLCVDSNYKIYRVLDEFTLENNILKRRSSYNYDLKSSIEEVENVQMKGRLK